MTTYESKIKTIRFPQEQIYTTLSDLNNLEKVKHRIPQDKIKDFQFDTDTVSVTVDKLGALTLRIINREPIKTIKFAAENAPADANLWIQLKEVAENDTKMKITLKAKLNPMIKMMLKGKLNDFINQLADIIAGLNYSEI